MGFNDFLGAVVNPTVALGTGAGLLGDYLGMREAGKQSDSARESEERFATEQMKMQREFAQMGIRWRVEDARAAGLHPLAALGASGAAYSPVTPMFQPDYSKSDFFRSAGQSVNRAMAAVSTPEDRAAKVLHLKSLDLDNKIKERQLLEMQRSVAGPGAPSLVPFGQAINGQGDSLDQNLMRSRLWSALGFRGSPPHQDRPAQEKGYRSDVSFTQGDDAVYPMIPESISESMEEAPWLVKRMWEFRNMIKPNIGAGRTPPKSDLPPGFKRWRWSFSKQGWIPEKRDYKTWFER